jgi:hypothetical protein
MNAEQAFVTRLDTVKEFAWMEENKQEQFQNSFHQPRLN